MASTDSDPGWLALSQFDVNGLTVRRVSLSNKCTFSPDNGRSPLSSAHSSPPSRHSSFSCIFWWVQSILGSSIRVDVGLKTCPESRSRYGAQQSADRTNHILLLVASVLGCGHGARDDRQPTMGRPSRNPDRAFLYLSRLDTFIEAIDLTLIFSFFFENLPALIQQLSSTGGALSIVSISFCILYNHVISPERPLSILAGPLGLLLIFTVQVIDIGIPNTRFGTVRYYGFAGSVCLCRHDIRVLTLITEQLQLLGSCLYSETLNDHWLRRCLYRSAGFQQTTIGRKFSPNISSSGWEPCSSS
jgi:hypothetical protein